MLTYYDLPRDGKSAAEIGDHEVSRLNAVNLTIPDDVKTVLDVGCGDGIICNPLAKRFDVVAIDFSIEALIHVQAKKLQAAAENLPFKKGTFDLILLSDILEHLSDELLSRVISQVQALSSKYILINVPNNEDITLNTTKCPGCGEVFHLNWHARSFTKDSILEIFPNFELLDFKYCEPPRFKLHDLTMRLKQIVFNRSERRPMRTICPFCGYNLFISANKIPSSFNSLFRQDFSEMVLLFRKVR